MKMAELSGSESTIHDVRQKRAPKLTEKATQEKLRRLIGNRKTKFGQTTGKITQIDDLKGNEDDLYTVVNLLQNDLCNLHKELVEL